MLLVLALMAGLLPTFLRIGQVVRRHPEGAPQLSEEARAFFGRARPYVLVMRAAALVALLLAVFRPVDPVR